MRNTEKMKEIMDVWAEEIEEAKRENYNMVEVTPIGVTFMKEELGYNKDEIAAELKKAGYKLIETNMGLALNKDAQTANFILTFVVEC